MGITACSSTTKLGRGKVSKATAKLKQFSLTAPTTTNHRLQNWRHQLGTHTEMLQVSKDNSEQYRWDLQDLLKQKDFIKGQLSETRISDVGL